MDEPPTSKTDRARELLDQFLESSEASQNQLARRIGRGASTLSQFRRATYRGCSQAVAQDVLAFFGGDSGPAEQKEDGIEKVSERLGLTRDRMNYLAESIPMRKVKHFCALYSQNRLAEAAGCGASTISQVLNRRYAGHPRKWEARLKVVVGHLIACDQSADAVLEELGAESSRIEWGSWGRDFSYSDDHDSAAVPPCQDQELDELEIPVGNQLEWKSAIRKRVASFNTVIERSRSGQKADSETHMTAPFLAALLISQDFRCVYCRDRLTLSFHLDHIHPLSRDGAHAPSNLQVLCPACNVSKGDRTHAEHIFQRARKIVSAA